MQAVEGYALSEAALNHVTRPLAASLALDIRVDGMTPGLVDTPISANWEDAQALWKSKSPMGRGAQRETSNMVAGNAAELNQPFESIRKDAKQYQGESF